MGIVITDLRFQRNAEAAAPKFYHVPARLQARCFALDPRLDPIAAGAWLVCEDGAWSVWVEPTDYATLTTNPELMSAFGTACTDLLAPTGAVQVVEAPF